MLTGGKLAAALLLGLAALGAVAVYFQDIPPDESVPVRAFYGGAVICAMIAGWSSLGPRLGQTFFRSAMYGIGAGAFGVVYFVVVVGFRSTLSIYAYSHFKTVRGLMNFLLERTVESAIVVLESRALLAVIVGSAIAGLFAEYFARIWR